MDIRVYFKHMETSLPLYAYAEAKIRDCLVRFTFGATDVAQLTFAVESGLNRVSFHVGQIAVDTADDTSMYAAVDKLADKLDARLRRMKEKSRSHRLGAPIDLRPLAGTVLGEEMPEPIDAADVLQYERARHGTSR